MGQNNSDFDRVYPVAPEALYKAFEEAVKSGPYKKPAFDPFTRSATFKSSMSFASWGHSWQGQVVSDPEGSRLRLTGATANANAASLNTSNKRAAKVAQDLFLDVSRRCAAATSA